MSPTTTSTEEIIEKRPSDPLATACLVLAGLALIGAIVLQLVEIGQLGRDLPANDRDSLATGRFKELMQREIQGHDRALDRLLAKASVPAEDLDLYKDIAQKSGLSESLWKNIEAGPARAAAGGDADEADADEADADEAGADETEPAESEATDASAESTEETTSEEAADDAAAPDASAEGDSESEGSSDEATEAGGSEEGGAEESEG